MQVLIGEMTETFFQTKEYHTRPVDNDLYDTWEMEPGEGVAFTPFSGMQSVFCTCHAKLMKNKKKYIIIDVPEGDHDWFNEPAGLYIVPANLVWPQ